MSPTAGLMAHAVKSIDGRTWQNVSESVLAHVGWFNGGYDRARLSVIGAQLIPLSL